VRTATLALSGLLGLASFYAGASLVGTGAPPAVHPLTGRPIAGIATDARWLERDARAQEEKPDQALAVIGIHPGMVVADIGAGSGYMTMRLATLVTPAGRVYANDIQPAMLGIIQGKVNAAHLANVTVIRGSETDAHLPQNSIDVALLVDVYHEMSYPQEMLRSIHRSLKADGRLVLVEYRKEDRRIPIADAHRMSVANARAEIEPESFRFDRLASDLPRQHILIFRKVAGS
jgi:predicted methyltransferase